MEEILGFETYLEQLVSWAGLVSSQFSHEILFSARARTEIHNSMLKEAQLTRGLRLFDILKSAFGSVPKANLIVL